MNKRGTAKYIWTVVAIVALFSFLILTPKNLLTGNSVTGLVDAPLNDQEAQPQAQQGVSHSVDEIAGLREALAGAGGKSMAILSPDANSNVGKNIRDAQISNPLNKYLSLEYIFGGPLSGDDYHLFIRDKEDSSFKKEFIASRAYSADGLNPDTIDLVKWQLGLSDEAPVQAAQSSQEISGSYCVLKYGPSCPIGFSELSARTNIVDTVSHSCNTQPNLGVACIGNGNTNPAFNFCCKIGPFIVQQEPVYFTGAYPPKTFSFTTNKNYEKIEFKIQAIKLPISSIRVYIDGHIDQAGQQRFDLRSNTITNDWQTIDLDSITNVDLPAGPHTITFISETQAPGGIRQDDFVIKELVLS